MSLVRVSGLQVSAGSRHLFTLESFEASEGEIVGLSGPNGKGKTTLLRLFAGLARPSSGVIQWDHRVTELTSPTTQRDCRRGLKFMAAAPALLLDQTVDENLEFIANAYGRVPGQSDFLALFEQYSLKGRGQQVVRSLSTGQKRRLILAALGLIHPLVLLADEPTNGLDEDGRAICLQTLRRDCDDGMLCIVASHDRELLKNCDRVIDIETLAAPQSRRTSLVFL